MPIEASKNELSADNTQEVQEVKTRIMFNIYPADLHEVNNDSGLGAHVETERWRPGVRFLLAAGSLEHPISGVLSLPQKLLQDRS